MKVQRLDVETMKIEYNISTSALPLIYESEDIVRTMHITIIKALNQRIKSLWGNILSYSSYKDEWKLPVVATRKITIPKGTRIAQFRLVPSQKATMWQKLQWLFSNGTKLKKVEYLNNPERKGLGDGTGN